MLIDRYITFIHNLRSNPKLLFWSTIIGNILDHYDSALYAFLAPFLAPIFFPDSNPVVGLILVYGLKSSAMLTRPLGAAFFGYLAIKHSIKNILALTLIGVAICTFFIGIIPTYNDIGILAPILLAVIRAVQGFFAAGEHGIAALFMLDLNNDNKKHGKSSSYYLCSTMAGSLLASLAATLVSLAPNPELYWRFAFIFGLLTAIIGIYIRLIVKYDTNNSIKKEKENQTTVKLLSTNKSKLFKIIIISSFSFLTYSLPFIFFNGFIPLISEVKKSDLLIHNTILMAIDIALLPIIGLIIDRFNFAKWMGTMSFLLTISIIPIFYSLPHLSVLGVTFVKLWIIVLGVAFVCPLYALLFKMLQGQGKYLVTGFGYSIGTDLIGKNIPAICLALWYSYDNLLAPSLYIAAICALTTLVLISEIKTKGCE